MSQKKDPLNSLRGVQIKMGKSLPDDPKFYVLQENKSACVFFSLASAFYSVGDKIASGHFKIKIHPL